jgi:hypothetical protein
LDVEKGEAQKGHRTWSVYDTHAIHAKYPEVANLDFGRGEALESCCPCVYMGVSNFKQDKFTSATKLSK